jgi:hypothetical protein
MYANAPYGSEPYASVTSTSASFTTPSGSAAVNFMFMGVRSETAPITPPEGAPFWAEGFWAEGFWAEGFWQE